MPAKRARKPLSEVFANDILEQKRQKLSTLQKRATAADAVAGYRLGACLPVFLRVTDAIQQNGLM